MPGAAFYEERLLFLLIRLRNPRAHVVYVTSQPVHPLILDYYLHLLAGVPASHARARLTLLCAYDGSPRPLTEKILERPRLMQRIRYAIQDRERSYLTVFNSTPLERRLSVLLGIPLNGLDPALSEYGTKSGSRRVFREAGVDLPAGFEDLRSRDDIVQALAELQAERPDIRRAVIKLNDSFSGEGNAIVSYPRQSRARGAEARGRSRRVAGAHQRRTTATSRSSSGWAASSRSSSRRTRRPRRARSCAPARWARCRRSRPTIRSSAASRARSTWAAAFPPATTTATQIRAAGRRVGEVLARHGVVSRFGVDFLAWRNAGERGLARHGARDQPARAGHDPPVSRAALPDRRRARHRVGAVPVAERAAEVLPRHRQPVFEDVPGPPARRPVRHRLDERPALQPPHRIRACSST